MSRTVLAAGAVVLRGSGDDLEVAVIHRPRYDDWSLPKGKITRGEYLAAAAVREVAEETGMRVRLSTPLGHVAYKLNGGARKQVAFWAATVIDEGGPTDEEADEMAWVPVAQAGKRLSYKRDVELVAKAARARPSVAMIVVRHGKALKRAQWDYDDRDRPLTKGGQSQARALVELLRAYGVSKLASSSSLRCMATLEPYSVGQRVPIMALPSLSEESFAADPGRVGPVLGWLLEQALEEDAPLAICGHRPVLPTMAEALGYPYESMSPGEVAVAHVDASGAVVHLERIAAPR